MRSTSRWICALILVCSIGSGTGGLCANEEPPLTRYYEQLRLRGLFSLAETHAETRLADPLLAPVKRIDLVIELSRTLVAHALSAADDQQQELWDRAAAVLSEELTVATDAPRGIVLEVYTVLVPAAHAEQLVWDVEASPFDEPAREALERTSSTAARQLQAVEQRLVDRIKGLEGKKKSAPGITVYELKQLLSHVRLKWGTVLQARARLAPGGSQERQSDLLDADERFRKVIGTGSDELEQDAKLRLAISNRLRDELERAAEMLETLERELMASRGALYDSVRAEQARLLLISRRPEDAAQLLLDLRTGRDRLPGEYWLVSVQSLSALRKAAAQRQATAIVAELNASAQSLLQQVDEQVGGSWSRRCRAVWTAVESVERYGQRLSALISRAEGEFLAGRIEPAIASYTSALELARDDGQANLEMDVGYTLAAILAQAGRWEETVSRCRQLVAAHSRHDQAPAIDLLGVQALGRWYEQQKNEERRREYHKALEAHEQRFRDAPTVSEAAFLTGQLMETGDDLAAAIAAYSRVKPDHPREPSAAAAILRCTVGLLLHQRDTNSRTLQFDQETLERVTRSWQTLPEQPATWTDPQTELAYHGVKAFLLINPPRFAQAEQRLGQLTQAAMSTPKDQEPSNLRQEIRRRIGPLRLITLAGQGRPQEAERLLGTLEHAGPAELLAVVEELGQLEIPAPAAAQRSLIEMQLASAEKLMLRRKELSGVQQRRLDLALAKAYLATAQPTKAVEIYQRLLNAAPRDVELARQLGQMLSPREELGCRSLVRDCWQRVEKSHKQGSPEWLDARRHVIESYLRLGDREQAGKLLKVTKLLYPKLGGDDLQRRYAELEAQLK